MDALSYCTLIDEYRLFYRRTDWCMPSEAHDDAIMAQLYIREHGRTIVNALRNGRPMLHCIHNWCPDDDWREVRMP
jgi:hypothetical protein